MSLRLPYALDDAGNPLLMPGGGEAVLTDLLVRRGAYVPEWRGSGGTDAGIAVARIFSAQAEAAIVQLQRLPEKLLCETLSAAGVAPAPQRPARALIAFTPDTRRLEAPLPIPEGFQLGSARADDGKGDVVWETNEPLLLSPIQLQQVLVFDGATATTVAPDAPFHPFGDRPALGAALYLGFTPAGEPGTQLSLGILPEDAGGPVAAGGRPPAAQPQPVLRWESLNPDRGFERADVAADGSALFTTDGTIRLSIRPGWGLAPPPVGADGDPLLWLRARLVSGSFATVPRLRALFAHAVPATAQQTFRAQPGRVEADASGSLVQLGKTNIAPGSVVLEVDDPITGRPVLWEEVDTLSGQPGDRPAFTLDAATGVLRFGDGIEGALLPEGLRYVMLRAYATVAGAESAVASGAISKPLRRIAGVASVTNPAAAVGGTDLESDAAAMGRGPASVKARGRAVTAADVALLALETEGANIVRAYAVAGVDATLGGARRPGSIGVFVIPARRASDPAEDPPHAGSAALANVARYVSGATGPVLARVTVSNPGFTRIRVETEVVCRRGADLGGVTQLVDAALAGFLDPEKGNRAWSLGDTIRHSEIARLILQASPDIESVPYAVLVTDGLRQDLCADVTLPPFNLPWPDRHEIQASMAGDEA